MKILQKAESRRQKAESSRVYRRSALRFLLSVFCLLLSADCLLPSVVYGSVGDGQAVYGQSTPTNNNPRTRAYTDANNPPFGAAGATNDTSATIMWVVNKNDPISGEYFVASASDTTDDTLYIQRFDGTTWNLDSTQTDFVNQATTTFHRSFDLDISQNTGDVLAVYENQTGSDKVFTYLYYNPQVSASWVKCTHTYSNATAGIIEWVKMAHHPTTDEISVVMSDSNDDLLTFVWTGNTKSSSCASLDGNWVESSQLATTLSASDVFKFDVAYEQSSGNALIAYSVAATAKVGYATKTNGQTAYTNQTADTSFLDVADAIALCPEPGSNYIGMHSIASSALDSQFGIWDGSSWKTHANNQDTATGAVTALHDVVACGWAGSGSNRIAVFPYKNSANSTKLDYFTWNKTTASACKSDQCSLCTSTNCTPASTPAVFVSGLKNHIHVDQWPGNDALMLTEVVDSNSDYWVLKFDGTSTTSTWTVLDDNSASNVALETSTSTAASSPADTALTAYDPTPVAQVANVIAQRDGGTTTVAWDTQTETRVKGFHVARAEVVNGVPGEFARITSPLIPASGSIMTGASYRVQDPTAVAGHAYAYRVEMIGRGGDRVTQKIGPVVPDPSGRSTRLDPATGAVTVASAKQPLTVTPHLNRAGKQLRFMDTGRGLVVKADAPQARAMTITQAPRLTKNQQPVAPRRAASLAATASGSLPAAPAIKLSIHEPGIYRVTGQALQDAGWDISAMTPANMNLAAQGKPVPIRLVGVADGTFDPGDYFEFWGTPVTTRYYQQQVYWLTQAPTGGARVVEHPAPKGGSTPLSYDYKLRLEGDEAYWPESPSDAHWFFDNEFYAIDGAMGTADIPFTVDHLVFTGHRAHLTVAMQGITMLELADNRPHRQHAIFYVNGTRVGEYEWLGDTYVTAQLKVPLKLLVEGENALTIEPTDEGGTLVQDFLVDTVSLIYPRAFVADTAGLTFPETRKGAVTYRVRQFSSDDVLVYIRRADGTVEFLTDSRVTHAADGRVVEVPDDARHDHPHPQTAATRYLAIPPSAVKTADALALDVPSQLHTMPLQHYVIIAPAEFHGTLAAFVAHRQATLVDLQDVYDEYSFGLPDPAAIRAFLLDAKTRGVATALLVGDGHFDPRNFQGAGIPEYVPVVFTPDRYGEVPWDGWFATPAGELLPQLAIGRWPVRTTEELQTIITKTLAYEAGGPQTRSVFLADDENVFRATHDRLSALLTHPDEAIKLYDGESDAATTKSRFLEEFNRGADLISYAGHGGIQIWSADHLFTNDDADALTNAGRYPVLLALGCLSGYFAYPTGLDALAERLLLASDKGTVAAISPAGLSSTPEQQTFGAALLSALENGQTLGESLRAAQQSALQQLPQSTALGVMHSFDLLGDPALYLHSD